MKSSPFSIRLDTDILASLDLERGRLGRSEFIEEILRITLEAHLVAGFIQVDRWGDLGPEDACPECGQAFGALPLIPVFTNGVIGAAVCTVCATME